MSLDNLSLQLENLRLRDPGERIADHVIKHIIAFSIAFPSAAHGVHNLSIIHKDDEIFDIFHKLMFYLDEDDARRDIFSIPFISCPCRIYGGHCHLCNYGNRMYSITDFIHTDAYNRYILANNIVKTYFLETVDFLLEYYASPVKDNNFDNWTPYQTNILHDLTDFIANDWDDVGEYDEKYECTFPLKHFWYMHHINGGR
jgi:hypothetical protein